MQLYKKGGKIQNEKISNSDFLPKVKFHWKNNVYSALEMTIILLMRLERLRKNSSAIVMSKQANIQKSNNNPHVSDLKLRVVPHLEF